MVANSYSDRWQAPSSLSPLLAHVLDDAKRALAYADAGKIAGITHDLAQYVSDAAGRIGVELSSFERDEILTHLEGDTQTFGILQQLVDDPSISDIIVSGFSKIAVQQ